MQTKFLTYLIFLVFTFYEVNAGVIPEDIYEVAEALLQDLSNSGTDSIKSAKLELNLLLEEINAKSIGIVDTAQLQLEQLHSEILTEISNLKNEDVDIAKLDKCIETYIYQITALPEYVGSDIKRCLNSTISDGVQIIDSNEKDIEATMNIVNSFQIEINACRLVPEDIQCIVSVIEQITIELIDLPARIKDDVRKTKEVIAVLEELLQPCADDRIEIVPNIGQQVIGYIKRCAGIEKYKMY